MLDGVEIPCTVSDAGVEYPEPAEAEPALSSISLSCEAALTTTPTAWRRLMRALRPKRCLKKKQRKREEQKARRAYKRWLGRHDRYNYEGRARLYPERVRTVSRRWKCPVCQVTCILTSSVESIARFTAWHIEQCKVRKALPPIDKQLEVHGAN
jgi:hypothetical protein